jgi:hypothetical protein
MRWMTGLSYTIAAGPRQRSHSRIRVPWDSRPHVTLSDLRLPFSSFPTTRRATCRYSTPPPPHCQRAFLHCYTENNMDEMEFTETEQKVNNVVNLYHRYVFPICLQPWVWFVYKGPKYEREKSDSTDENSAFGNEATFKGSDKNRHCQNSKTRALR